MNLFMRVSVPKTRIKVEIRFASQGLSARTRLGILIYYFPEMGDCSMSKKDVIENRVLVAKSVQKKKVS